MNKADLLRLAKQKIDELALERRREVEDEETEQEVVKMAIEMQRHEDVVNSLEALKINPEVLTNAMREAVATIKVESPDVVVPEIKIPPIKVPKSEVEVKIPEIKIPPIKVPKPEVTVNVPEQPAPIVNIEEKDVIFPDFMDVGLQNITPKTPLHVMPVGPDGKFVSPAQTSAGPREVKATLNAGNNVIGKVALVPSDSANTDAFARLRVSNPTTIFDSKQLYDDQPLLWDNSEVSGAGTSTFHSSATASTKMTVTALTAGKRVRQTFMRFNYQPGKSQLIFCTGTFTSGSGTGIKMGYGYYDSNNGFFVQDNEGTIQLVKRASISGSVVDTEVDQADWNIDPMDGSGPSKYKMDFTKSQILVIDFEWLGVGRARMGFVIDGIPYYCHEFNHANVTQGVYMSTPNLPVRYEIENDGNGGAATLEHICSTVISEGGLEKNGVLRHVDTDGPKDSLAAGNAYVLLAGRLKSTHLSSTIIVDNLSLQGSANDQVHWEFRSGGTVGAALSFADIANSSVQVAQGGSTYTITGGTEIDGGYFSTNQTTQITVPTALHLGASIDGTPQEWYLVVVPITNNITLRASVTWRELL